ncbi:L,D-transpeptidase family protein [Peptostreptococcus faecalis]|uniref:L,D-transpeptidase family protein n=1 Tax=Peptostreptococcus faecalis TaxID=2045015 RepID=UPI000C7E5A1A|nr:L,D-transpeptidase family protein [Peptostreptococcus faecalis]
MSRVERKRLERERKKNMLKNPFKKAAPPTDSNIENAEILTDKTQQNYESAFEKEIESKINVEKAAIKGKENDRLNKGDYNSSFGSDNKDASFETGVKYDYSSQSTIVNKPLKAKTADKIISVEDERMYYERKKRQNSQGSFSDIEQMTVEDILTLEDEIKIKNGDSSYKNEKKLNSEDIQNVEENINVKKKINIEEAPFEDVVRVAESRLAAEKMIKNNEKKGDIDNKMSDEKKINSNEEEIKNKDAKKEEIKQEVQEEASKQEEVKQEAPKKEVPKKETLKKEAPIENEKINTKKKKAIIDDYSNGKTKKSKGGFKKVLGVVGLSLVVIYGVGCVVFNNRFLPNTTVNGIDVSMKTPEDLDKLAAAKVDGYQINIKGRNNVSDVISGSEVDMQYISDDSAKKVKSEQGSLGWPMSFFKDSKIDGKLNIKVDEDKLSSKIEELNVFDKKNIKAPVSAYPRYDEKEKGLVVDKGDLGSTPIASNVSKFVEEAIKSQATKTSYPKGAYKAQKNDASNPKIKEAISKMEKYTNMKIEYNFEYEKYVMDGKDISKMFDLDSEGDYDVKLDKDKVRDVVRSLSRKYSTYGDDRVIKSASTGGDLKVTGGIYGWLIDREKETDALYEIVKEGKNVSNRTPIYAQTAVSRQKDDMGDTFIEIDLSKQYMWLVKDGEVMVSTPVVTGQPNRGDATPPGIYPITYKTRNATLRGPGYASPVSFWIPFNGNVGIHDSPWQAAYGGSRYLYAGSHGCVNTPYGKAAVIYANVEKGMPVVVHY